MRKKLIILLIILSLFSFYGCKTANDDHEINASEDVQHWAQYEIDGLIRMLTVDGFFEDEKQAALITINIQETKITNLQLVKQLDFYDNHTIDLYALDFMMLPDKFADVSPFVLDEDGWIISDDNFIFGNADGAELKQGQLYLMINNNEGELTSMGIRRAITLTDEWGEDLLAYYNYPPGINFNLAENEIQSIYDYWKLNDDWSFSMPSFDEYGNSWTVGLGYAHEWGLGIPYKYKGYEAEPAQALAALTFSTVERRFYDGFNVVTLSGFYGDKPEDIGFSANQYISTTQPDCETSRGIHVGDTVEALRQAYPEAYQLDNIWTYAPEDTNRSIMFLTQDDIIVQIDMADGLDGQYTSSITEGGFI